MPTKISGGGSRGSAKSRCGRDIALLVAFSNPGVTVWIVCRNLAKAEENFTEKYRIERPELMKYYKASSPPEFAFPPELGGSRIAFRYGDSLDDIIGLARGPEVFFMVIEQAEMFSERELQELNTCARWPDALPGQVKTLHLHNPGGQGAGYLRRVFHDKEFKENETPGDYFFVQMFGWDCWNWFSGENIEVNGSPLTFESFYALPGDVPPALDGKYDEAWLATVPDHYRFKIFVKKTSEGRKMWAKPEAIRAGDLFGSFDQFEGQYYLGVWQKEKIVIKAQAAEDIVKPWWPRWIASDWGFAHESATGWAATGQLSPKEFKKFFNKEIDFPVDVVVVNREYVVSQTGEGEMAQTIVDMTVGEAERRMLREYWLSPDAWQKRSTANTISDGIDAVMRKNKFPIPDKADDDRAGGWRLLWNCLKQTCSMLSDTPSLYPGGFPMLLISEECTGIISTIPILIRDPKKPEDVLKVDNIWDNIGDMLRYLLKSKLSTRSKVPREVQVREVLTSAGEDPNARAMAMRQFEARNKQSTSIISRPRWRI